MKKYVEASEMDRGQLVKYIDKVKKMVSYDVPECVSNMEWDMEDNILIIEVFFSNGDQHLFTFDIDRFSMTPFYETYDADIIVREIENYVRNTGIDPFLDEDASDWEILRHKSVEDSDGFTTDYTLWYNPATDYWVCIFGDNELYTPDNSSYDAEFETEKEAYEWFNSYGEEDWMDIESCDSIMAGNLDRPEMTATEVVMWMYDNYNDYEYYDERDLGDDEVRLIFEEGKKSSREKLREDLLARKLSHFFRNGRLYIDAKDDYETEYVGESCNVKVSEEYVDMGTGLNYWYFTTHGIQPGSVPKGLNIIKVIDKPEGTYFLTDRVLTTKSLKYYDIKERAPKGVSASKKIKASYDVGDNIVFDSNYIGVNPRIHSGKVKTVKKSFGSKGSSRPSIVYVVEDTDGNTYKVDEAAVIENSCDSNKIVKASSHMNLQDRLSRIIIQEKDWNNFIRSIEYETGLKVDSAYKRRNRGDNFIILYDDYGGDTPDVYEAEITEYSDGSYELLGENIYYKF